MKIKTAAAALALFLTLIPPLRAQQPTVRIKDIARIEGCYSEQLVGYGLVVGLARTGDSYSSVQTRQTCANLLNNLGIVVPQDDLRTRNVAAVMVTADLSTAIKEGERVDVLVSSIGDADSLRGGALLMTPLRGMDGKVRAMAQGPLCTETGQENGNTRPWSSASSKPLTAVIANGALVLTSTDVPANDSGTLRLRLNRPDYSTCRRMAAAIEAGFGVGTAMPLDSGRLELTIPPAFTSDRVTFISQLEQLTLVPDRPARVVINERSGTVVMGAEVCIAPVAVSHGNIKLVITSRAVAENPPAGFETMGENADGATLQQVIDALKTLNVNARDLVAIIRALDRAGVLEAELEVL